MLSTRGLLGRFTRSPRGSAVGRCPVCHDEIHDREEMLTLRGDVHVHRACATYSMRRQAASRRADRLPHRRRDNRPR